MNEDSEGAQLIQNNAQRQVSEFTFVEYLRFRYVLTNAAHSFSYKDKIQISLLPGDLRCVFIPGSWEVFS